MNAAYLNTVLKMAEDALLKPPLAPEEDGDEINQRNGFRDRVPRSIVNHDLNEIPKWCPLPDKE